MEQVEVDVEIKASAEKFHQMFVERPQDISKASPENIQGYYLLEGEFGKVGSIMFCNYAVDGKPQVSKEMIDTVDPENNLLVLKIIEGDVLNVFKSFYASFQATQNQEGPGSVVKCILKYERIDENVAHPENELAMCVNMCKDMDEMISSEV